MICVGSPNEKQLVKHLISSLDRLRLFAFVDKKAHFSNKKGRCKKRRSPEIKKDFLFPLRGL
ncbi:hypothetical protein B1N84_15900 [Listeria monocytogenes]|nr:hypothetical protein [Listeria monocytogenes]MRI71500.1 hypothetical protein [Enterococcus casseliflavus]HCO72406.1 hypothetical protein [Enterococcus sp.]EAC2688314.1 hypothetical protein [Listeria monocytogenes]EAC3864698.1 hypothetical protein [Listeria monocytogenes]